MFSNMLTLDLVDRVFADTYKPKKKKTDSDDAASEQSDSTSASMKNSWRSSVSSIESLDHLEMPRHSRKACCDFKQFEAQNICLTVEAGNTLLVQGEQEQATDKQGVIVRHFSKREIIPEDCDVSRMRTELLKDGVLIVTIPKKKKGGSEGQGSSSESQANVSEVQSSSSRLPSLDEDVEMKPTKGDR